MRRKYTPVKKHAPRNVCAGAILLIGNYFTLNFRLQMDADPTVRPTAVVDPDTAFPEASLRMAPLQFQHSMCRDGQPEKMSKLHSDLIATAHHRSSAMFREVTMTLLLLIPGYVRRALKIIQRDGHPSSFHVNPSLDTVRRGW